MSAQTVASQFAALFRQGKNFDVMRTMPGAYAKKFTGKYTHRTLTGGIGHNLPQEAPQAFADAVAEVDRY